MVSDPGASCIASCADSWSRWPTWLRARTRVSASLVAALHYPEALRGVFPRAAGSGVEAGYPPLSTPASWANGAPAGPSRWVALRPVGVSPPDVGAGEPEIGRPGGVHGPTVERSAGWPGYQTGTTPSHLGPSGSPSASRLVASAALAARYANTAGGQCVRRAVPAAARRSKRAATAAVA